MWNGHRDSVVPKYLLGPVSKFPEPSGKSPVFNFVGSDICFSHVSSAVYYNFRVVVCLFSAVQKLCGAVHNSRSKRIGPRACPLNSRELEFDCTSVSATLVPFGLSSRDFLGG